MRLGSATFVGFLFMMMLLITISVTKIRYNQFIRNKWLTISTAPSTIPLPLFPPSLSLPFLSSFFFNPLFPYLPPFPSLFFLLFPSSYFLPSLSLPYFPLPLHLFPLLPPSLSLPPPFPLPLHLFPSFPFPTFSPPPPPLSLPASHTLHGL